MRRLLLLLALGLVAFWALDAQDMLVTQVVAQDDDDDDNDDSSNDDDDSGDDDDDNAAEADAPAAPAKPGWSGPGFYFNWIKIVFAWLLFLLWVHSTDWVNRDAHEMDLDHARWNPIIFGPFMGAFVLLWLLPFYWLGFPILVAAYVVPMTLYVRYRNPKVELHKTVFTPEHLRYWFAVHLRPLGVKMEAEKRDPLTTGVPLILDAAGAKDERDDRAHLGLARQSEGFPGARQLLADGLYRRSDSIMLEFTQEEMAVKHMVDGVWHPADPWDRESSDLVLEALKLLAGLKPEDRRSRQDGTFAAEYMSEKYSATINCQGTKTGERVVIKLEGKKTHFETYDDLGMRPKMQDQTKELMALAKGFVLFSGVPSSGLRTTMTIALQYTDRFMRELVTLEDEDIRYEEVENVMPIIYKSSEGETPDQRLGDLFHKDPDVLVIRDLVNGATVARLCQEIEDEERLIISSIRAKDAVEALLRVLALKVPPADFARAVSGVVSQRLIRKLCVHCKEAYTPTQQVLQQLRIPQGRVESFYREPTPNAEEEICSECSGIGYVGRTAIFETLIVDATVRKVLASNPKIDLLRKAARKAGIKTFQDEGVVLVAKGVTSLTELMRVLKQ